MATRTVTDLATSGMLDLGLLNATETPSATDRDFIATSYAEALEELRDEGLVWWEAGAIPLAVFPALTSYMAITVSEGFGKPRQVPVDVELEAARRRIRRRIAKPTSGEQTSFTDY